MVDYETGREMGTPKILECLQEGQSIRRRLQRNLCLQTGNSGPERPYPLPYPPQQQVSGSLLT